MHDKPQHNELMIMLGEGESLLWPRLGNTQIGSARNDILLLNIKHQAKPVLFLTGQRIRWPGGMIARIESVGAGQVVISIRGTRKHHPHTETQSCKATSSSAACSSPASQAKRS